MGFRFKQPLVGEKRCVTTLITAAEETRVGSKCAKYKRSKTRKINTSVNFNPE